MCCILSNSYTVFGEEEEEEGKDFKLFLGNAINESVARLCTFTCISLAMDAEHKTTKISQFE